MRSEIHKPEMNTKCNVEVGIKFGVSSTCCFFFYSISASQKPQEKIRTRLKNFHAILKENLSHGSVVVSFHCLMLSLSMNKVSLMGARAPSLAVMSHWII